MSELNECCNFIEFLTFDLGNNRRNRNFESRYRGKGKNRNNENSSTRGNGMNGLSSMGAPPRRRQQRGRSSGGNMDWYFEGK